MKTEFRYKSIVIPFTIRYDDIEYIVVQDKKTNELTFVGGGCKKKELSQDCAIRELSEETRGVFPHLKKSNLMYSFSFESNERSKKELKKDKLEGVQVTMIYDVYFIWLNYINFYDIKQRFHKFSYDDDETSDIQLLSKNSLLQSNLWPFMKNNILHKLI